MRFGAFVGCMVHLHFLICCSALPRGKDFHTIGISLGSEYDSKPLTRQPRDGNIAREPSCEELRAMWRFSKRQSRATEITNEIPTYRDPFAYNVWEPYARSRSVGGGIIRGNNGGRHVYGRIVHDAPRSRPRESSPERVRAFEEVIRMYGTVPQMPSAPRRKVTAFRLPGGSVAQGSQLPPLTGSFQQLKELIRTERARELQEQRIAEEAAARTAALEGAPVHTYYGNPTQDITHPSARYGEGSHYIKNPQPSSVKGGLLTFPDMLAPVSSNYNAPDGYLSPANHYYHISHRDVMPCEAGSGFLSSMLMSKFTRVISLTPLISLHEDPIRTLGDELQVDHKQTPYKEYRMITPQDGCNTGAMPGPALLYNGQSSWLRSTGPGFNPSWNGSTMKDKYHGEVALLENHFRQAPLV
uniref:Uncharacterized protein n=1 Tax=Timema monikensis TaxID=170555 RepID=A0A7R9HRJ2_9NEOP|nr:unnamed protein product [Timema monikensis]